MTRRASRGGAPRRAHAARKGGNARRRAVAEPHHPAGRHLLSDGLFSRHTPGPAGPGRIWGVSSASRGGAACAGRALGGRPAALLQLGPQRRRRPAGRSVAVRLRVALTQRRVERRLHVGGQPARRPGMRTPATLATPSARQAAVQLYPLVPVWPRSRATAAPGTPAARGNTAWYRRQCRTAPWSGAPGRPAPRPSTPVTSASRQERERSLPPRSFRVYPLSQIAAG